MTEDEILKIHANVFCGALKSQNYAALEELYSDDYRLVRPDGSVAEQAGSAARPAENGLMFHSIDLLHRMVRIYGSTLTGGTSGILARNHSGRILASRSNRTMRSASLAKASGKTFSATSRPNLVSQAR